MIDELTVRENILVPTYLSRNDSEKRLSMLLKKLGIEKLADQKVRTLSGGQKQRVAIARELMKDPQVLIADEPTAALDAKTAHEIGALLTSIAKERTVIVVTHDISLIQGKCSVFELDKGVLIRSDKGDSTTKAHSRSTENLRLTMRSALRMAGVTGKRQMGKLLSIVLAMAIAASCLAVNFSGMLNGSSSEAFQELLEKQGNSVLNLLLVPSFTSGGEVPSFPKGYCETQQPFFRTRLQQARREMRRTTSRGGTNRSTPVSVSSCGTYPMDLFWAELTQAGGGMGWRYTTP